MREDHCDYRVALSESMLRSQKEKSRLKEKLANPSVPMSKKETLRYRLWTLLGKPESFKSWSIKSIPFSISQTA
jgi:hypothetical protein